MKKSILSRGIRKFLRTQKALIRKRFSDPTDQERAIKELYSQMNIESIRKHREEKKQQA